MKLRKKKGFTIIELVIVIAVIGVLTAVLVPTFVNLTQRANQTSDQSLVKNLNIAMAAQEGESGKKNSTYNDAITYLDNYGYRLANLATKAGEDLLWNSKSNRFLLNNAEAVAADRTQTGAEEVDYWTIKDAIPEGSKYSIYAGLNFQEPEGGVAVNGIGFDAGSHNFSKINYTNNSAKEVVIRTNSANTTLTIDAASDTVKHYGAVGSLNIIAVAGSSYHEFGQVAFAEIANGRIVLESNSAVEHIHLNTTVVNNVTVFDNITVAKASDVEMPEFSRDPVEIPAEGKLVVALQDGTDKDVDKDYVWLTAVGVYEQVTVSESKTDAGHNYAANSNNEEKKEAAQQIANTITFSEGGEDYKVTAKTTDNGTTWTYEVVDNSGNVSEEYSAAKDTTKNTVNVQTTGDNPETVETAKENGLSEAAKEEKQTELVNEAIIPELADQYEEETTAVVYNMTTKVHYEDLYTAIAEVPENTKTTLVLLKSISGTSNANYQIPANKSIVLDLNGKVLNTVAPDESAAYTIMNYGTLVIKDATDKTKNGSGTGKITSSAVKPDMQDVPGYASNTITNHGNLTIESGIIENRGDGYACFAIDNQTNGNLYTPVLTINGGKMVQESQQHYAVRMFCNSTTKLNKTTINGGIITGGYSFWLQTPNNDANMAELIINGGEFIARDGSALYFGGSGSTLAGRNYSETTIIINDGKLGKVMVGGVSDIIRAPKVFKIFGGSFEGIAVGDNISNFLFGGIFSNSVENGYYELSNNKFVDYFDMQLEELNSYGIEFEKVYESSTLSNPAEGKDYYDLLGSRSKISYAKYQCSAADASKYASWGYIVIRSDDLYCVKTPLTFTLSQYVAEGYEIVVSNNQETFSIKAK